MRNLVLTVAALAAVPAAAQEDIFAKLLERFKTSKDYTLAIAEAMPEDGYTFKPNPAQMDFGHQLEHLASDNAAFIGSLAGKKPDFGPLQKFDKQSVIRRINEAFDFSIQALASVTPEQFHGTVKTFEGSMTGLEVLLLAIDHTSNHRGQAIVYLRARNIKPPGYRF